MNNPEVWTAEKKAKLHVEIQKLTKVEASRISLLGQARLPVIEPRMLKGPFLVALEANILEKPIVEVRAWWPELGLPMDPIPPSLMSAPVMPPPAPPSAPIAQGELADSPLASGTPGATVVPAKPAAKPIAKPAAYAPAVTRASEDDDDGPRRSQGGDLGNHDLLDADADECGSIFPVIVDGNELSFDVRLPLAKQPELWHALERHIMRKHPNEEYARIPEPSIRHAVAKILTEALRDLKLTRVLAEVTLPFDVVSRFESGYKAVCKAMVVLRNDDASLGDDFTRAQLGSEMLVTTDIEAVLKRRKLEKRLIESAPPRATTPKTPSGAKLPLSCFNCGVAGHLQDACPTPADPAAVERRRKQFRSRAPPARK